MPAETESPRQQQAKLSGVPSHGPEAKEGAAPAAFPKTRIGEDLISLFFHESISRVVPGLVVLFLYAHNYVKNAALILHDSSLVLGVGMLAAAWLMGMIVETVGFVVPARALQLFRKWGWFEDLERALLLAPLKWPGDDKAERIGCQKLFAEKLMFRGLLVICVITLFTPKTVLWNHWNVWYGLVGFVVFTSLWYWEWQGFYDRYYDRENPKKRVRPCIAKLTVVAGVILLLVRVGLVYCFPQLFDPLLFPIFSIIYG